MARPSRAGATVPVRHGKLRRGNPWLRLLQVVGIGLVVVVVSATSIVGVAVASTLSSIRPGIHLAHISNVPAPQIGSIAGAVNILLTGTDTRSGQVGFEDRADLAGSSGYGNNDVTMVMHISADHQHATVVSIPRDLLVNIPACPARSGNGYLSGTTNSMFNSTLSRGGLSCTVLTAEKLTGLNIQYAAEISFDGVIEMSNAVGGVTVCLGTAIKDTYVGLNLPAGEQTIEGSEALAFLRSRHGVGDGSDLGRISDQQLFLSSLMRKISSAGVLSNPLTLYQLANAAVKNMQLSDTLTAPTTMVAIALALKNISLNNIVFVQWPTKSNPAYPGRVVAEEPDDQILATALDNDEAVTLSGKLGRATEAAPSTTATPSATTTATPTPTATAATGTVALPADVTGQTAAEQTCAVGYLQKKN